MKEKTIDEEIPVTKEDLLLYRKGLEKELDTWEARLKRIKLALKRTDEYLEKMR